MATEPRARRRAPPGRHQIAVGVAVGLLTALWVAQPASAGPWNELHRPLQLAQLGTGEPCPVSGVDPSVDWETVNIFGSFGIGPGPVYPGIGSDAHMPTQPPGPWFGQKVFWYVEPTYRDRVLIRGRRLDGPEPLRFRSRRPRELRIGPNKTVEWDGQPPGSRGVPSGVYIRTSGCYGVKIDGTNFSRTIVFTASTP
jgi:hypothetical protein